MKAQDRYDSLIRFYQKKNFPELSVLLRENAWLLIKAQVAQESSFMPGVKSKVGARGLMQLMPNTAGEIAGRYVDVLELVNPELSLDLGTRYLARQYRHFPEIPEPEEKLKFALASYNGGRGYVNKALELARAAEGKTAQEPGEWQRWAVASKHLFDPDCKKDGLHPDAGQMTEYVSRIMRRFGEYMEEVG